MYKEKICKHGCGVEIEEGKICGVSYKSKNSIFSYYCKGCANKLYNGNI